jgi:RNA polymerase sigma factor (sigma-70 family)
VRGASRRFLDHIEWARSLTRRWRFIEGEDVVQAALLGLHLADVAADPDMPEIEFLAYASTRVRGEAIDHLRRVGHGGRRQGLEARRPRNPDPESIAMAIDMGLFHGATTKPDAEHHLLRGEVARRFESLSARSKDVLWRRLTGEEEVTIASDYAISTARVSQIAWEAARAIAVRDPE